jgi:gamma-glutamyl hercynylcysteine S-oxide synthase
MDSEAASLRKNEIARNLMRVRERTLHLLSRVPDAFLKVRVHDFYSPVGWHFGHIGMTEEHWAVCRALSRAPRDERLSFLFANLPENPKDDRVHLPERAEIRDYLTATRCAALEALDAADLASSNPLVADGYAWEFALQHECQHQETICELLQLIRKQMDSAPLPDGAARQVLEDQPPSGTVRIPGGKFKMGSEIRHDYDNEHDAHEVEVAPFELDRRPVTAGDWALFIADGGYHRRELWSDAGWAWREPESAQMPEYWFASGPGFGYYAAGGTRALHPSEPVTSISWFEADAYARWRGMRLPTEAEWEFAAGFDPATEKMRRYPWGDEVAGCAHADCEIHRFRPLPVTEAAHPNAFGLIGMAGGAWEWTSSPFLPYPGFEAFPYDGYSKEHMDGNHMVCRGGSWATSGWILRCSFRNWYVPTYRQGFLGLRCAR